ncbi:MAG TPA: DUF1080 domain-containing protein, partial [Tepidisphaeraceae bacterium]
FPMVGQTFLSALIFTFLLTTVPARAADDDKPTDVPLQPLCNGKDLTNFKVPDPNPWWKVEEGVLTGQSSPDKKGNVIYTEKSYDNFVLESDVRFGDNIDSGYIYAKPESQVQIGVSRSLKVDMTGSIYYKGKYPPDARAKGVDKLLKLNDWNTLRMEKQGRTTKVWLNGQHVLTYNCPDDLKPAPIGLQVHPGVAMKVEFKNLRIAELK